MIRLEGQGDTSSSGTIGALVLTIAIAPEETVLASQSGNEHKTVLSDPDSPKVQSTASNVTASSKMSTRFRRLRLPRGKVAIIIGLVLIILLVSANVFYFKYFNFVHRISLLNAGIANPYPPGSGSLALNDPLSDNSLGYFWEEGGDAGGSCAFSGGTYDVKGDHYCPAGTTNFSNFAFEAQTTIIRGEFAGIAFRLNDTNRAFYYFRIGTNGSYSLDVLNGNNVTALKSGSNSAINMGLNQTNLIAVVANGPQIDLYVNKQHIDSVTDSTFSQGQVGVAVSDNNNPTEAVFSNAKVWAF